MTPGPRKMGMGASSLLLVLGWTACGVGRGEGQVESRDLDVPDCHAGAYQMDPTFFASSPYEDSQVLRIQRGDSPQANSDALIVAIHSTSTILGEGDLPSLLDEPIDVYPSAESLPANVLPVLGQPLVTMALHLGETCREEVITWEALSGNITFSELYDGEPNRPKADRLIEAEFNLLMGDPRDVVPDTDAPTGYSTENASRVSGWFRFYYRRGQPAQSFP